MQKSAIGTVILATKQSSDFSSYKKVSATPVILATKQSGDLL
jgi:hypothetical protein